jgi:sugar/nucleoside kinase (ribokinase family)
MSGNVICVGNLSVQLVSSVESWPEVSSSQESQGYALSLAHGIAGRVLALAESDNSVHLISRIGHDDFGDLMLSAFRRAGVNTTFVKRLHNFQTPCNVKLVLPDGEMSEVSYPNVSEQAGCMQSSLVTCDEIESARAIFVGAKTVVLDYNIDDAAVKLTEKLAADYGAELIDYSKITLENEPRLATVSG